MKALFILICLNATINVLATKATFDRSPFLTIRGRNQADLKCTNKLNCVNKIHPSLPYILEPVLSLAEKIMYRIVL